MKKSLLCFVTAMIYLTNLNAQVDENGYTTVELTTGPAYANRVFFDLSENNTVSQNANNWDVAFYRNNAMDFGTRVNDAQNIEVYEASDNPANWDAITIADLASWGAPLYNPDLTELLNNGAFEQGSATYGWGEYNFGTHHVEGKVIFVLKYLSNESYVKFMIEDYYGGYTFKYSKWDGSAWGATQTHTVANGSANTYFNYFSFDTNAVVENNEPAIGSWDLMFTRYWTLYQYTGGEMMYRMSGVLQSPSVEVAKVIETQATNTVSNPTEYSKVISAIGHSWKPTSGLIPDVVYYIKEGGQIYRLYFTENGGASTGNMYFKYKNVTGEMGVTELNKDFSFGLYPNPTVNKQVTLVYDVKNASYASTKVSIFNLAGQKVYETNIQNQSGFYQKELNLNNLATGTYVVVVESGNNKANKKLVVK